MILDAVRGLVSRVFGPDRLDLIRNDLRDRASEGARAGARLPTRRLHAEAREVEQALYRQPCAWRSTTTPRTRL